MLESLLDHLLDKIPLTAIPSLLKQELRPQYHQRLLEYYLLHQTIVDEEYYRLCNEEDLFRGRYGLKEIRWWPNHRPSLYLQLDYWSINCGCEDCSICTGSTNCTIWLNRIPGKNSIEVPSWFWNLLDEELIFLVDDQITIHVEGLPIYQINNPTIRPSERIYGGSVQINRFQIATIRLPAQEI